MQSVGSSEWSDSTFERRSDLAPPSCFRDLDGKPRLEDVIVLSDDFYRETSAHRIRPISKL